LKVKLQTWPARCTAVGSSAGDRKTDTRDGLTN